jgi:hypothetical protein
VGDPVEAVITEPLVASNHLILPEGSGINGSVMQVSPARRLGRNGQLRILFREVAPPNGIKQKVETNLEGVAVAKGEHLKLDNEGGAEVTTPDQIFGNWNSSDVGDIPGFSRPRCGAGWAERRRSGKRSGEIYLLPFSGTIFWRVDSMWSIPKTWPW